MYTYGESQMRWKFVVVTWRPGSNDIASTIGLSGRPIDNGGSRVFIRLYIDWKAQ